jgi:hypothetical protein
MYSSWLVIPRGMNTEFPLPKNFTSRNFSTLSNLCLVSLYSIRSPRVEHVIGLATPELNRKEQSAANEAR